MWGARLHNIHFVEMIILMMKQADICNAQVSLGSGHFLTCWVTGARLQKQRVGCFFASVQSMLNPGTINSPLSLARSDSWMKSKV